MELELIHILMVLSILENEKMINKKEKELKIGPMGLNTKETMKMELNLGKGNYSFRMVVGMKENFTLMKLKGLAFINGRMGENIKVNGRIIKCMERVNLSGQVISLRFIFI